MILYHDELRMLKLNEMVVISALIFIMVVH